MEIIGDDDQPVSEGQYGEVVITTLGVEAMPLLRFRTGDIASIHTEPCKCGRNSFRISPLIGRKNQMIKYKGTTLYPNAIFDVLDNIEYVENYYVEVSNNEVGMDKVKVVVGCNNVQEGLIKDMKDRFRARLRVAPDVVFEDIDEVRKIVHPQDKRKAVKFIDKR